MEQYIPYSLTCDLKSHVSENIVCFKKFKNIFTADLMEALGELSKNCFTLATSATVAGLLPAIGRCWTVPWFSNVLINRWNVCPWEIFLAKCSSHFRRTFELTKLQSNTSWLVIREGTHLLSTNDSRNLDDVFESI